jgi:hypothetical protein
MRALRLVSLAVVLYVGVDVLDPSVPGVFFFDAEHLFVDGVIQGTGHGRPIATAAVTAAGSAPTRSTADRAPEIRTTRDSVPRRPPERPATRTDTRAPSDTDGISA